MRDKDENRCGACTLCCSGEATVLHPEKGDDPAAYETETVGALTLLKQTESGDCVYLGPSGCSIYGRRPSACRKFDCAQLVTTLPYSAVHVMVRDGILKEAVVEMGHARVSIGLAGVA